MGLAYLFALVVGAGLLTFQAFSGGHDGHHAHDGADGHHKDVGHDHGGFVALFFSTRFWIFAALGFGLSGSLLTYVLDGAFLVTLIVAVGLGLGSGLAASAAFRALRSAPSATSDASTAVGRTARVLVPIERGKKGQVRIELDGQLVDLVATSDEESFARGATVVIEEIDGERATVTSAPKELE